jgi:hypothetical protein
MMRLGGLGGSLTGEGGRGGVCLWGGVARHAELMCTGGVPRRLCLEIGGCARAGVRKFELKAHSSGWVGGWVGGWVWSVGDGEEGLSDVAMEWLAGLLGSVQWTSSELTVRRRCCRPSKVLRSSSSFCIRNHFRWVFSAPT